MIQRATTEQCRRLHDERVHGWRYARYKARRHRFPIVSPHCILFSAQYFRLAIPPPVISNETGTTPANSMPITSFVPLTGNCCVLTGWTECTAAQLTFTGATDDAAGGSNTWVFQNSARESTNKGYVGAFTSVNMKASKPTTITVSASGTITGTIPMGFWLFDILFPQATPTVTSNAQGDIPNTSTLIAQVPLSPANDAFLVQAMANDNGSATIAPPWNDPGDHIITWMISSGPGTFTPTWTVSSGVASAVVGVALAIDPSAGPAFFNNFTPGAGTVGRAQRFAVPY